jgi:sugar phosphate permease
MSSTERSTGQPGTGQPGAGANGTNSGGSGRRSPFRRVWFRSLDHYPDTGPRILYLGIVVLATIVLYYQLYVPGSVSPSIIEHYGMTFRYYVYAVGVVAAGVGAFSAILAGMADRWGRANMVTYGLAFAALLTIFAVPNAPNKTLFVVFISLVGFVEGVVLVATPALVRDFSPQRGRGTAMGFWTLGPVVGSLVVATVATHTLPHLPAWQDQFRIAGIAGLVVFAIALVGLRELSPGLRDQLMISIRDRTIVESRARGVDVEAALKHPWRQMLKLDIIGPALGSGLLLLVYYALVGFLVVYFATIFHYPESRANSLANWFWAFNAGALVVVGLVSDRVRVRKPFMVLGAGGAIVTTILFLERTGRLSTSYDTFVVIMSLMAVSLGIAYAPWFAAFTETIERRNPALSAHGLAVGGWVGRIVITISALVLPFVVSSMNTLVTYGPGVASAAVTYAPELQTAAALQPATLTALSANPHDATAGAAAVAQLTTTLHVTPTEAIDRLVALGKATSEPGFRYLQAHGTAVTQAAKNAPSQWKTWWWVCVAGQILFIPFIFLMAGRWSPSRARRDAEEHQKKLDEQIRKLAREGAPPVPTGAGAEAGA